MLDWTSPASAMARWCWGSTNHNAQVQARRSSWSVPVGPQGVLWENGSIPASVLVAGSSVAVGATIGFLFGFPKSARTGEDMVRPSTNLEEISDWLTKVIVGATLTQCGFRKLCPVGFRKFCPGR